MKKILTASCLCEGIKFKTSGEHRNVSNCHCIQCRKTHGIYGSYSNVKDKDIKFITKKPLNGLTHPAVQKEDFVTNVELAFFLNLKTLTILQ